MGGWQIVFPAVLWDDSQSVNYLLLKEKLYLMETFTMIFFFYKEEKIEKSSSQQLIT